MAHAGSNNIKTEEGIRPRKFNQITNRKLIAGNYNKLSYTYTRIDRQSCIHVLKMHLKQ